MTIEPFPATQTIEGTAVLTLKSRVDGLTEFTFQLSDLLAPGQILVSGNPVGAPVSVGIHAKRIQLDRAYNADEVFDVTIPYAGSAPQGSSGLLWSGQDNAPVVSSFSEPFDAGTWWPCKDADFGQPGDNTEKATWEIAIIHDSALTAVSNGTLLGIDDLGNGKSRSRWASVYPMATYLACFSVAKYNSWAPGYSGSALSGPGSVTFPLRFFIYSSLDTPANRAAWQKSATMLDVLRPLYGEYPFPLEGYGIYQFPFAGGMEHQTLVGQGNFAEGVTIHELGHQWWGDNVTCRTWHDIWLNEGFATYTEALWAERKPGSSGASALQAFMVGSRPDIAKVGGTVFCDDISSEARIFDRDLTYRKAGWVLHMLRGLVGDQTFFEILAAWRNAYQGSAASTEDFRALAEQVSGLNLETFFNEWVYGIGAPSYAKGLQSFVVNGKNWTRFHVRQTQDLSWPVFTHPLTVEFATDLGPVRHVVRPIARTSFFVRSSGDAGARDLFFDPDRWVLNYGVSGETPLIGPPVVLEASPVAGSTSVFATSPSSVQLVFSEPVSVNAAQFELRRVGGDAVPLTFDYNPSTLTATLAFGSRSSPGVYRLVLLDDPLSLASSQPLDGDVFAPGDPASFPTGDGLAGTTASGTTLLEFSVVSGACPCDLNLDGQIDDGDFVLFAGAYNELISMAGDFSGDGLTDDSDFVIFAEAYDNLLCP
ncbi:MAG: M1 family aminopeptidase [Phycisphaerales bacterium]|nr:hypothetical protein [Planctomycetota bacterium]